MQTMFFSLELLFFLPFFFSKSLFYPLNQHKTNLSPLTFELPIIEAARVGDVKAIKKLLKNGELVHESENGWQPLHVACAAKNWECVKVLLEADADPNQTTTGSNSPLMKTLGSYSGLEENVTRITHLLLERNAELNVVNDRGFTAAHMAACCGHIDALKLLYEARADLCLRNKDGNTPLDLAFSIESDEHVQEVRNLVTNMSHQMYNENKVLRSQSNTFRRELRGLYKKLKASEDKISDLQNFLPDLKASACKMCKIRVSTHACLPCGHLCLCEICKDRAVKCPIRKCRREIQYRAAIQLPT